MIDGNKPIKSQMIRILLVGASVVVLVLLYIATTTDKVKQIGPVMFNTKEDTPSSHTEINNGIKIENMEGDIIKDSATKNVYLNKDTGKLK